MVVLTQLDPGVLEQKLLERVNAVHPREVGARTLIVVPTTRLGAHVERRLADVRPAWLGLDVLHFHAVARRIVEDSTDDRSRAPRRLSARLREALLRAVLSAHEDNTWTRFTRRRPGTLRRLVAALADLREARTTPDELAGVARDPREIDLAELYRAAHTAFGAAAERGFADDAGTVEAAIPHAADWARRYGAIFLHGAYELIGVHVELLKALETGCAVTALLPAARGRRVSEYADAFIDRALGGTAAAVRLPDPLPIEQRPALAALYDETSRPRPGGVFVFHHTQGVSAEVTVAVREALAAIDEGCPPTEIAITARTIEPYVAALEEAFDEHGLPWTCSLEAPLLRQPLARDFLLALRIVAEDFPRAPTAEFLRSPRIDWAHLTTDGRAPAGARADAWSRGARILGGLDEWRDGLLAWVRDNQGRPRSDESDDAARKRQARNVAQARHIGAALGALHDRVQPLSRSFADHAHRLDAVFGELFEASAIDVPAGAAVRELLTEMAQLESVLADRREVPFREMVHWLEDAMHGARLPLRPTDDGGIRVLDAMQLRGMTFRRVHVLGANSGLLPRPARRDPILDDRLRERLERRHGRPLAAKSGPAEERLLLSQLLGAAAERVHVSWQRADESGRARTPSLVLREIARMAFGVPDTTRIDMAAAHWPSHPAHWVAALEDRTGLLTPDEGLLALALESTDVASARAALAGHPELHPGLRMLAATQAFHLSAGSQGFEYDAVVGPVDDRPLSVSAIESLGGCPLRFFFQHVLRVREFEDAANPFEQLPKEQGTQIHGVLERVYTTLDAEGLLGGAAGARAIERAYELLDAERHGILGALDDKLSRRLPLLHERIVERWLTTLRAFVKSDLPRFDAGRWQPRGFERFVEGRVEVDGIAQELRGRFDRTVERSGKLLVGDYKASTSLDWRVNTTKMLKGSTLQVPLYAMLAGGDAAVELLGVHPDLSYDDSDAPWQFEFDGFNDKVAVGFRETLHELLAMLHRGEFPFHADQHCKWCPYTHACRRHDPPSVERQGVTPWGRRLGELHKKSTKAPLLQDTKK